MHSFYAQFPHVFNNGKTGIPVCITKETLFYIQISRLHSSFVQQKALEIPEIHPTATGGYSYFLRSEYTLSDYGCSGLTGCFGLSEKKGR